MGEWWLQEVVDWNCGRLSTTLGSVWGVQVCVIGGIVVPAGAVAEIVFIFKL